MPVRFGRRRTPPNALLKITVDHVRRGVAALHALSRAQRADPELRVRRLIHALRDVADGMPVDTLVAVISMRIAAFERMLADRPHLLGGRKASADLEHAVYLAMATEPLLTGQDGRHFEPENFARRVDDLLTMLARHRIAASAPRHAAASLTETVTRH
jgi:hypothetical protein